MRGSWSIVGLVFVVACLSCGRDRSAPKPVQPSSPQPVVSADKTGVPARKPLPEPKLLEPLQTAPTPSDVTVVLPPVPTHRDLDVSDQYPDEVWSIAGVRNHLDSHVRDGDAGKTVEIRGWVQQIYEPPTCPEGQVCPPAKQPHLWITDTKDERGLRRALLVVNYAFTIPEWEAKMWKGVPEVTLEVGKQYTIRGKVRLFSDTGFAHQDGLLEFVAYQPKKSGDFIAPPGSPWHPLEQQRQEQVNADLRARMAKP